MSTEDLDEIRRLVSEAVKATSLRIVAKQVGVSHGTIDAFCSTGAAGEKTQRKLEAWARSRRGLLNNLDKFDALAAPPGYPYDLAREAADLARASAIEDPMLRMLERESVLAVIRTQWGRETAWAARIEAQNAARAAQERADARAQIQELERAHTVPSAAYQPVTTKSR